MRFRQVAVILLTILVCSCVHEYETEPSPVGIVEYPAVVNVAAPRTMKSGYSDSDISKLTDLNVFIYHRGRLVGDCSRYYDDVSDIMLAFPVDCDGYDIYMLGNVGKVAAPEWESEITALRHLVGSYEEFRIRGVPVAGAFMDYMKGDPACFTLQRMVGQFNIRVRTSAQEADYQIRNIKVVNCARDIYPFSDGTKATVFTSGQYGGCMDELTAADVEILNDGGAVTLYFVENLQGCLLEGNMDPRKKIPSSLPDGVAERCTYVEVTADITTPGAKYKDGKYRFYPGEDDVSDFSIRRNTLYDVVLDFTQNMVHEEEWRIEVGEPEVVEVVFSKDEVFVTPYRDDVIYVYSPTCNIDEVLDMQQLGMPDNYYNIYVSALRSVVEYNGHRAYRFVLTVNNRYVGIVDKHELGKTPVALTSVGKIASRETYNGNPLVSRKIKVNFFRDSYPLLFKIEKFPGESAYSLVLRGHNPCRDELTVSAEYEYNGMSGRIAPVTVVDLSEEPTRIGTLDEGVLPDNLSRIDITLLQNGEYMFGSKGKPEWGPDQDQYPALFKDMEDDADCAFWYTVRGMNGYDYVDYELGEDRKMSEDLIGVIVGNRGSISPSKYEAYFYERYENMFSGRSQTLFHVLNGGLYAFERSIQRKAPVRYPDRSWCGCNIKYYGTGRDLFFENKNGQLINGIHQAGYWVTVWKPLIGNKVRSHQESKFYQCQLYMTINGCLSWPGNDVTPSGYFTDEY